MWLRLRQIALVAHELRPVLADLHAVFGVEVCFVDKGVKVFGLENSLMPFGHQYLEVVAPIQDGTTAGRYLDRRGGDGGYMVITQCDDHAPRRRRVEGLGIRLAYQFETHEYRCMQLHPKDTGGSFFEIDEQLGERAHALDGPWEPAGPGAPTAARSPLVTGIAAAELQADDPEALAARWAAICELDVHRDPAGRPAITLDNAALRFVPVTDGRGEGLGGIDVAVTDRAAVLAAAEQRGLRSGDDQVAICGMRLRLV